MFTTDPIKYFSTCQLEESSLFRFLYHPEDRVLDLVIDYAAETVSKAFELQLQGLDPTKMKPLPADLRHFRLANVTSLQISGVPDISLVNWEDYERFVVAKRRPLTGVEHSRINDDVQMSFLLDRFGDHTIRYKTFMVESRFAEGNQIGVTQWEYRDASTQEKIDLFNPFPWIDRKSPVKTSRKIKRQPYGLLCPNCSAVLLPNSQDPGIVCRLCGEHIEFE